MVREAILEVARLMAVAAKTAPKAVGKDFVTIQILEGEEVRRLGEAMVRYGEEHNIRGFIRDGKNVLDSEAVVLIGLKDAQPAGLNCGACGFERCSDLVPQERREFKGPQCVMRLLDLGIALGSAVKMASLLNVDNRIMYRIGVVARKEGMVSDDVVMGIPLSAWGKNIYFDRKE